MLATFLRVIIVMAVFLAGTLVGNIYMPQKKLEAADLVSVKEPVSALNVALKPDTAAAIGDLATINSILTQNGKEEESALALQDNIQKTLLLQTYLAAKYKYQLELLKADITPEQKDAFIKAKNDYNAAAELIETTYPQIKENEIEIISAQTPAPIPAEEQAQPQATTQDAPAQNIAPAPQPQNTQIPVQEQSAVTNNTPANTNIN